MFDDCLWNAIETELFEVYASPSRKRPTKFSQAVPVIRSLIDNILDNNVSFLAEFPSCIATNIPSDIGPEDATNDNSFCPYVRTEHVEPQDSVVKTDTILNCLHATKKIINEAYNLCRTVATEILVFMVNDLDRTYQAEMNNAHVIAYAMKGSSMTNHVFSKMVEQNESVQKRFKVYPNLFK